MSPVMVDLQVRQRDLDLLLAALKHGEQKIIDLGNFVAAEKIFKLHAELHKQIFEFEEA